jgi:hypothetical protein
VFLHHGSVRPKQGVRPSAVLEVALTVEEACHILTFSNDQEKEGTDHHR